MSYYNLEEEYAVAAAERDNELDRQHRESMRRTPFNGPPFGGCQFALGGDQHYVLGVVMTLLTCDHPHNFAVERDGPGGRPQVYCSENALDCLESQGVQLSR
jgi:hypothetical protein